jgi:hypothetical protein
MKMTIQYRMDSVVGNTIGITTEKSRIKKIVSILYQLLYKMPYGKFCIYPETSGANADQPAAGRYTIKGA